MLNSGLSQDELKNLAVRARLAKAVPVLQKAIELSPLDPETHNTLANTLQGLGRLSESEAGARRAIEFRPDFLEAHCSRGNVLLAQSLGSAMWKHD